MDRRTIKKFRLTHQLKQAELAQIIGTTKATISAYERGHLDLQPWFVKKMNSLIEERGLDYSLVPAGNQRVVITNKKKQESKQNVEVAMKEDTQVAATVTTPIYHIADLQNKMPELFALDSSTAPEVLPEPLPEVLPELPKEEPVEPEILPELPKEEPVKPERPASAHYHTGNIDVWAFGRENYTLDQMTAFHGLTATKYITRFGKKGGYNVEDLEKAMACIQEMIDLHIKEEIG